MKLRLFVWILGVIVFCALAVAVAAQTLPLYGLGTAPPLAKVWASTNGTTWSDTTLYVSVGATVSFKATTPLGAPLPSVDTDTVNGAASEQDPNSFVCAWDLGNGTFADPVAVDAVVSRTYDTAGRYSVTCFTDDLSGTVYDDPQTPAAILTVIVSSGADDEAAQQALLQAETLLSQGNWRSASGYLPWR